MCVYFRIHARKDNGDESVLNGGRRIPARTYMYSNRNGVLRSCVPRRRTYAVAARHFGIGRLVNVVCVYTNPMVGTVLVGKSSRIDTGGPPRVEERPFVRSSEGRFPSRATRGRRNFLSPTMPPRSETLWRTPHVG